MHGRLFALVSEDDNDGIYAWSMEITHSDGCAAMIYRWDPTTWQSTQGVHGSAESARALYSRLTGVPLTLVEPALMT